MHGHLATLAIWPLLLLAQTASAGNDTIPITCQKVAEIFTKRDFRKTQIELSAKVIQPDTPAVSYVRLEDETGVVDLPFLRNTPVVTFHNGTHVKLAGKIVASNLGSYWFEIESLQVVNQGFPPEVKTVTCDKLMELQDQTHPVNLVGVVRDVFTDEFNSNFAFIVLENEGKTVLVAARPATELINHGSELLGAKISIFGCIEIATHRASRREPIFSSRHADEIKILQKPSSDLFAAPDIAKIASLPAAELQKCGRHRTSGHVIATWNGKFALLKRDNGDISRLEFALRDPPEYGIRIEAVGFPESDLYHQNLNRVYWRKADSQDAFSGERPQRTTISEITTNSRGDTEVRMSYHGRAISIVGRVLKLPDARTRDQKLVIDNDGTLATINVSSTPEALAGVKEGCTVEVHGTCVINNENWRQNRILPEFLGVLIITRTASDVRVIANPPWLTPRVLLALLGVLAAALLGIFIWGIILRALVERRSRELFKAQVARVSADLKVDERTRLAIELHDSISQNLTGASMQIDAVRKFLDPSLTKPLKHLGIASRTINSCREELRNCIWDLRNRSLDGVDLNEAIRKCLSPLIGDRTLLVRFSAQRSKLSDNTFHAILRIVRELTANAIRHGGAHVIRIAGAMEGYRILFSVTDDGCGFDPDSQPGIPLGHFGLQGIAERIKAFHGNMRIESEVGKGTRVRLSLGISRQEMRT